MKPRAILVLGLAFAFITGAQGQDKSVANAPTSATAATAKAAPSAGLVNDWLREQSSAFSAWDIGGEFRMRYDFKENAGEGSSSSVDFMKVLPPGKFNDNAYLILRERVHLGYTPVDWITAFVEGRDATAIDDRRKPSKVADTFDLQLAWLKVGDPKNFPLTAKVGRLDLAYGDERMVGRADWSNLGPRAFDAGFLRFENQNIWVDAFVGRPVMAVYHAMNEPNYHDWLSGIYASSKTLLPFQETQLYFLAHNADPHSVPATNPDWINRPSTPQDTYSPGLRFKSLPDKFGGWDYSLEAVLQFGNVMIGTTRLSQQAYAVMASGGYTWKKVWGTPRLGVGYDFFSGDSDPHDSHNGTFEPLFPTNHKPLGLMDLVGEKNIHDPRVHFSFKPVKVVSVNLEWHYYLLAETADYLYNDGGVARVGNGYGSHPQYSSNVGSEFGLDVIYTPKAWLACRTGYGHFFVGDYVNQSLAASGRAQDADCFYAQLTFSF